MTDNSNRKKKKRENKKIAGEKKRENKGTKKDYSIHKIIVILGSV